MVVFVDAEVDLGGGLAPTSRNVSPSVPTSSPQLRWNRMLRARGAVIANSPARAYRNASRNSTIAASESSASAATSGR